MSQPEQVDQALSAAEEIVSATDAFRKSGGKDAASRSQALVASRKLIAALEDPAEAVMQHAFAGPERLCVRVAVDLRLFHILAQHGGKPVSASDLATESRAEAPFIIRIMRVLVAIGFVGESGRGIYLTTPLTMAMTAPPLEAAVKNTYDHAYQAFAKMPAYFRQTGYRNPTDSVNGPLQFALDTKLSFFDYLGQDPQASKEFDTFMIASRNMKPHWVDWYPVKELILDGYDESGDSALMVDIGGGYGQDLEYFKKKFPSVRGLILQDLPRTIAEVHLSAGIKAMGYDFFTKQPIQDARVYFFHLILHDWPDHKAREFLSNTASAMKPGYSKLIVNEFILPDEGCDLFPALADIHMMADFAGTERSESQFRELYDSAGLEVVRFWQPPGAGEGIIEAIKKPAASENVLLNHDKLKFLSHSPSADTVSPSDNQTVTNRQISSQTRHSFHFHHVIQPALDPPTPAWKTVTARNSDKAFWWSTTGCHMAFLLEQADYGDAAQDRALSFYNDLIAPCLGSQPSSRGTSDKFNSYCLDDYSPIEYSWCWNSRGGDGGVAKPKIRFAIEAIGEQAGSSDDPWNQKMSLQLKDALARRNGVQANWELFDYFWGALLPALKDTRHNIEMPGEEDTTPEEVTVKAYFMPMLRALQDNASRTEMLDRAIGGVDKLPGALNFPALSAVIEYMNAPYSPDFEVEMLAVDCVEPSNSRVKIYIRSQRTAWDVVSSILTLQGRVPISKAGLDNLRTLWHSVLDLEGRSDAEDLPPVEHSTGGAFFCFYAKAGQSLPSAKLYVPIKHYARDDAAAAKGLAKFLEIQGEATYSDRFWDALQSISTHRDLDKGKGVQTYLSAQVRSDGGLALTSYLGPEIYHGNRWIAS